MTTEEETSTTEDLEAAWEAVEESEPTPEVEEQDDAIQSTDTTTETEEIAATDTDTGDEETVRDEESQDPEQPPENESGAPVSWSATAREAWKKIPKEAQSYIQQRETQMTQGMQKNADLAKRAEGMDQALAPYAQYLSMNGGAGQALQTLLQTGAGLQMGSPAQKAQTVAGIIKQYGVDVTALDNLLAGEPVPEGVQQRSEVQQAVAEAVAPYQQMMQRMEQGQQAQVHRVQEEANTDVSQFANNPKNEFYNDVSNDMADLMDMSANRGAPISLQDAYQKACTLHPEVSKIILGRQQQATLANKRRAATSVTGAPGGVNEAPVHDNIRNTIEDAWENAGRT